MTTDLLWCPRHVYPSIGDLSKATGNSCSLTALPRFQINGAAQPDAPAGRWQIGRLINGKVIGDMRLIATRENDVPGQLQTLHGIDSPERHWSLRQWRLRRPRRLRGTAAVVAAASGSNYYHWLFDSLPRLHLLRTAGCEWSEIETFLLNGPLRTFDVDSLALLGIPIERITRCSKRQVTTVDELIVPPMPTTDQGQVAPWMCEFLRSSFLARTEPSASGTRLYLSRRNSPKRRLANEAQIESLFCERGFKSIFLENLSFQEQVQTFAGATFVAGPHGAGFANLVFTRPNTRVIELFHPGHQQYLYKELAAKLGLNYQCIVGTAPDEQSPSMSEKLGPYTIEPELVKKLLNS